MMILGILKAVLKKDFQTLIKYKLNLFTTLFSILFYVLIVFFFSETFTIKDPISEGNDQNSLFLFFLSGLLLIDLISLNQRSCQDSLCCFGQCSF